MHNRRLRLYVGTSRKTHLKEENKQYIVTFAGMQLRLFLTFIPIYAVIRIRVLF